MAACFISERTLPPPQAVKQGRYQGKLLKGAKVPQGTGAKPLDGGVKGETPWNWCLFSAKIVTEALSE